MSQYLAYDEWLTNARAEANIEDFWSMDKAPEDPLLEQQRPYQQLPSAPQGP
jgi:hypothetical protein